MGEVVSTVGSFMLGAMFATCSIAFFILAPEEEACRQEHNVYECQRVYIPVEVAE